MPRNIIRSAVDNRVIGVIDDDLGVEIRMMPGESDQEFLKRAIKALTQQLEEITRDKRHHD